MEDRQIIDLFFARSENAIRETENKYGKLCYRIAHNILNDVRDSQECMNDIYLCLWNTIPPQRPQNFTAYICKVARNVCLKKLEYNSAKKRASQCEVSLTELESVLTSEGENEEISDEGLGKLINEFLRTQKKEVRNVFIRRYYFYEGVADIAKKYGFSEAKVKSMLFHTRNKLRKFLIGKGVRV